MPVQQIIFPFSHPVKKSSTAELFSAFIPYMKNMKPGSVLILVIMASLIFGSGCKHDPVNVIITDPDNPDPSGVPCEPGVVYFVNDVLPILVSNCAFSGCHDAASAQDGVILTDYNSVMNTADVRPGRPGNSDLYEVLVDDDVEDRMPRFPNPPLTPDQINIIYQWIAQGAKNNACDETTGECLSSNMSYVSDIMPILQNHCMGCHQGTSAPAELNFQNFSNLQAAALNGRIKGAINHQTGFSAMPKNGNKLNDCQIDKISSWIDAGAPNN